VTRCQCRSARCRNGLRTSSSPRSSARPGEGAEGFSRSYARSRGCAGAGNQRPLPCHGTRTGGRGRVRAFCRRRGRASDKLKISAPAQSPRSGDRHIPCRRSRMPRKKSNKGRAGAKGQKVSEIRCWARGACELGSKLARRRLLTFHILRIRRENRTGMITGRWQQNDTAQPE